MHDVRLRSLLGVPVLNASLFITVIYSIREMVARSVTADIMDGGLWWFTDLSDKDPIMALPLVALGLSYIALDHALPEHGRILRSIKDFLQSILLVSTPYVMLLPTGVFCYWIPSSMFMIAQVYVLRNADIRKFLGIENTRPEHLKAP
jgi:YidC/Oxa1 family membrane protein insertase